MLKVLELVGLDHKNLVCQTCRPNSVSTADPLPMTADAISHQTSLGYHLSMKNRQTDRETGLEPLRGREEEREEGRLSDAPSPVQRNLHGEVSP